METTNDYRTIALISPLYHGLPHMITYILPHNVHIYTHACIYCVATYVHVYINNKSVYWIKFLAGYTFLQWKWGSRSTRITKFNLKYSIYIHMKWFVYSILMHIHCTICVINLYLPLRLTLLSPLSKWLHTHVSTTHTHVDYLVSGQQDNEQTWTWPCMPGTCTIHVWHPFQLHTPIMCVYRCTCVCHACTVQLLFIPHTCTCTHYNRHTCVCKW